MTDPKIFIKALIVSILSTTLMMLFADYFKLNTDPGTWFVYQQVVFWGISIESQIKGKK